MRFRSHIATFCLLAFAASHGVADEEFSLVIDPFTGSAALRNDGSEPVELDSYFIASSAEPILDPTAWTSLEDGSVSGFRESFSDTGNRLGELNLFESLTIPANGSVAIGSPYTPFAPAELGQAEPALSTINFTYTLANESSAQRGDVEFSSRNTLVLVVDPATGTSSIQNQSAFDINLDSYLIKSTPSAIDVAGWSPLSTSDAAWRSANGQANRIAEGNLFGSTLLSANGGSLPLGSAIDSAILDDEGDLVLEFTTTDFDSSINGGVLFRGVGGGDPLDCNGDGVVDIADANCTSLGELDGFLAGLNPPSLRADADGNGEVAFADFLTLSTNFGQAASYTGGDFDLNGTVEFADFLVLSTAFGTSAPEAASVPEPSSLILLAVAMLGVLRWRVRS